MPISRRGIPGGARGHGSPRVAVLRHHGPGQVAAVAAAAEDVDAVLVPVGARVDQSGGARGWKPGWMQG
jgi:hypothetical protein